VIAKDKVNVIILAGGQGTRIKALYPDVPKPMIPVAGRPFIEWVIEYFFQQGLRRFIISLGYQAHIAEDYFQKRVANDTVITTVRESAGLGTGGALLFAHRSDPSGEICVVANGDSLVLTELSSVWKLLEDPAVDAVIVGVEAEDAGRYGSLKIGPDGRLLGFQEKQPGQGLINAGVYFFKRHIFSHFPQKTPLSLEVDGFPELLKAGVRIRVYACKDPFIDIGTPEGLEKADSFLKRHFPSGGDL